MTMLQGKVVLVTGCAGTLGRSAVRMFLERGASVVGVDQRLFDEIEMSVVSFEKRRWMFRQADLTNEAQVKSVMEDINARFGCLHGVYHNVYTNVWKAAEELSLPEWEATIQGTLTSTFLVCKYAISLMKRSGGGSIVNTSSVLSHLVQPGCLAYGAAKAGVNQLTRVIAADYAAVGIRANAIAPGDFKPKETIERLTDSEREALANQIRLGRSGTADEINEVAAFLLSDASTYVTGSIYHVDGGFHV